MFKAFLASLLIIISCTGNKLIKKNNICGFEVYSNKDLKIKFCLPQKHGWDIDSHKIESDNNIIFEAVNVAKLIDISLSAEDINSSIEDYYLLIRNINNFDINGNLIFKEKIKVNNINAIKFIYKTDIITNQEKNVIRPYIITNIIFKNENYNFWLEIATMKEAYERKKNYIENIINGIRFFRGN